MVIIVQPSSINKKETKTLLTQVKLCLHVVLCNSEYSNGLKGLYQILAVPLDSVKAGGIKKGQVLAFTNRTTKSTFSLIHIGWEKVVKRFAKH